MGCSMHKNSQKNNQSHLSIRQQDQSNENQMFYEEFSSPIKNLTFSDWKLINLQNRTYISFWDKFSNEFKLLDVQTTNVYCFNYQGHLLTTDITIQKKNLLILILTDGRLYQLQIIDCKLKIIRQFFIKGMQTYGVCILQYWKKLVLMNNYHQVYMIRFGQQNRSKKVFKTRIDTQIHSPYHNIQKGLFICGHQQQFIKVFDIISKQQKEVQIKCPDNGFNLIQIKLIKFMNDYIDIVFDIYGKSLFYNKINYQNCHIVCSKFIYYQADLVYEDDGLVALQTQNYYIQLDKDYNIFQKFQINIDQIQGSRYCGSFIQKIGQFLISIYTIDNMFPRDSMEELRKDCIIFKQQMNLIKGIICLKQVQNYQLEIENDPIISQNQQYLAFKQSKCLIFYKIQQKVEQQYFFDQEIKFIQFSTNSRYLYVACDDRLICFRCQQNLKFTNQWIYKNKFEYIQVLACQNLIDKIQYCNQLTNNAKKIIFRINSIQDRKISTSREMYMMSNNDELFIYRLADRKQFSRLKIENLDLKLMYNVQDLLILSKNSQLELWNFYAEYAIFKGVIFNNVRSIYNRNFNIFELEDQEYNTYLFDYSGLKMLEFDSQNSTQKTLIIDWRPIIVNQEFIIYQKKKSIYDYNNTNVISLVHQKKESL